MKLNNDGTVTMSALECAFLGVHYYGANTCRQVALGSDADYYRISAALEKVGRMVDDNPITLVSKLEEVAGTFNLE